MVEQLKNTAPGYRGTSDTHPKHGKGRVEGGQEEEGALVNTLKREHGDISVMSMERPK